MLYLLQKRPTQLKVTLESITQTLSKVQAKVGKTRGVRASKKEKVKAKMEAGVYLPKEAYEAARKEKLERRAAQAESKTEEEKTEPKKKERGEKKDFKKTFNKDDKREKKTRFDKGGKAPERDHKGKRDQPFDKRKQNDKVKDFKKERVAEKPSSQSKLHPSWEAKKEQVDRDSHIKFVSNEIFEF